jgi:hypothetical protein
MDEILRWSDLRLFSNPVWVHHDLNNRAPVVLVQVDDGPVYRGAGTDQGTPFFGVLSLEDPATAIVYRKGQAGLFDSAKRHTRREAGSQRHGTLWVSRSTGQGIRHTWALERALL